MKKRPPHSSEELERFKSDIPLADYLANRWSFAYDAKESCRGSIVMRHDDGRKLIVARGHDLHYIFFNVHDPADNGSIIDFCLNHLGPGATLGHVRKELRPFLGGALHPPALPHGDHEPTPLPDVQPIQHDLLSVRACFAGYKLVSTRHPYLTKERAIPPALLAEPRFRAHIRQDDAGCVIFPHFDDAGDVCGYEITAPGIKQFSSGGTKGLWLSQAGEDDTALLVAESAIDALSYAALRGHDRTRFASICGQMNKTQPALLTQIIQSLPAGSQVIAAFDHDQAGLALAEQLSDLCLAAGCPQVRFRAHLPSEPGQDWNDALRANLGETPEPRRA